MTETKGMENLRESFDKAPEEQEEPETESIGKRKAPPKCFYVNEIGIKAVAERDSEALDFLIECLDMPEVGVNVRYAAVGFLGDLSRSHPGIRKAYCRVRKAARKENDPFVKKLAVRSMRRLRKQLRRKRKVERRLGGAVEYRI